MKTTIEVNVTDAVLARAYAESPALKMAVDDWLRGMYVAAPPEKRKAAKPAKKSAKAAKPKPKAAKPAKAAKRASTGPKSTRKPRATATSAKVEADAAAIGTWVRDNAGGGGVASEQIRTVLQMSKADFAKAIVHASVDTRGTKARGTRYWAANVAATG